jgi:SAM-dependent methyltransferase
VGAIVQHAEAWTEFWLDQHDANGCCAYAPEIRVPIHAHWSSFARLLRPGSHVLDLGCGMGSAASALTAANPQLHVAGIDFAAVPASADPHIDIHANTRMESLPFPASSCDAAISQFGFEYASVGEAASELARVLRPGAPFSFLVHNSKARIASDGIRHRKALEAITGPELEAAFLSGNAAALERQLSLISLQLPYERIVDDAGRGLRRHIGLAPSHRTEIWRAVKAALAPELVMLAHLERSSVAPDRMRRWLRPLAKEFDVRPPVELKMANGQSLCWKVEGVRRTTLH